MTGPDLEAEVKQIVAELAASRAARERADRASNWDQQNPIMRFFVQNPYRNNLR